MGDLLMNIENGYIKLEDGELAKYYRYLDSGVKYPIYLEKIIVEVILERLGIEYDIYGNELNELFELIPDEEIDKWISVIDELYKDENKVDYENIKNEYLAYYLPINIFKIHRLLRDLIQNGLLKGDADILDIGCGPGSATIGIIEFYKNIALNMKNTEFNLSITLLDAESEFLSIAESCIEKIKATLPQNLKLTIYESINSKVDKNLEIEYMYDYLIISNLLNGSELDESFSDKALFKEAISSTSDTGAILIIEPGESRQCNRLKLIRNNILSNFKEINIYSPCNNVWGEKSEYKCRCFSNGKLKWRRPYIIDRLIDKGLKKKVNHPAFNYLILRKDGNTKYNIENYSNQYTMLKDIKDNNYISVKGIVRCVMENGNYLWVSICDGTVNLNDNKHYSISIRLNNKEMVDKHYSNLITMNIGEKIIAKNVKCEQMWKYPNSYLLNVDDKTELELIF